MPERFRPQPPEVETAEAKEQFPTERAFIEHIAGKARDLSINTKKVFFHWIFQLSVDGALDFAELAGITNPDDIMNALRWDNLAVPHEKLVQEFISRAQGARDD